MSVFLHSIETMTSIVHAQVPNPDSKAPPGLEGFTNKILGWLKWACGVASVVGLLSVAIMMGVGVRGRSTAAKDALSHAPWVFAATALTGSAAALIGAIVP
jgi:hydrogenase/urease accessory protein HupE